jgi:hypothetical protein
MGDSDAGWLGIFGFAVVVGIVVIAGWVAYPFLTGHQYMGTVSGITTLQIEGRGVRIMQLKEFPGTYIAAPPGFQEGDYVMVGGHVVSTLLGTVVIGTDNIRDLDISARVSAYATTPLFLGLVLIAGGIVGYIVSVVVLVFVFAASGSYLVLRWIWDARKSPAKLSATLLSVGGAVGVMIGAWFGGQMQALGLFMLFASLPFGAYVSRRELMAGRSYYIRLAIVFALWLSSGPLLFFAFFYFAAIITSQYPDYILYLYFLYWVLFPAWVGSLFYSLEKVQSRYGRCCLCRTKLPKTDLSTCTLCWKPFCRKHIAPSDHDCKSLAPEPHKQ